LTIRGDLSNEALDQFVSGFPVNILQGRRQ
jgi:hypothetical protein